MEELVTFDFLDDSQRIAVARLVREKPLNSLLLDTINQLSEKIFDWLNDDNIKCIVLDSSSERAFCAGADIAALYHSIKAAAGGENAYADAFFLNEYRLDYALHQSEKPILAWGNGIVMGGGLGLLGGCSHRIGTPTTKIAMPEITIGLFPDAGGTAFLSAMPDGLGVFAGLTGCQLSASDALALGLIDTIVAADAKQSLFTDMTAIQWGDDHAGNCALLTQVCEQHRLAASVAPQLLAHRDSIKTLMRACADADDYLVAFEQGGRALPDDAWLQAALQTYRSGSPTTARIFVEQMQRAKGLSLAEMFQMELIIAYQCARHDDFPEGVRALLIDKDKNPQWRFPTPAEVPDDLIEAHFTPVWEGPHPLADLA